MKKKNLFLSVFVMLMLLMSMTLGTVAFAQVEESECDKIFETTLTNILDNEGEDAGNVLVSKTLLYDIALEPFGYIYDFNINIMDGYAIVVNTDGNYFAPEIFLDCKNPYEGSRGQLIYVTQNTYICYDEGQYIDIKTNLPIAEESVEDLKKVSVYSSSNTGYEVITENISFLYKAVDEHKMSKIYPSFKDSILNNSCVPTSGANIIWFYDRFHENLIPNFTPGKTIGKYFVYNSVQNASVEQMSQDLMVDMGTNGIGAGTSIAEFKSGMNKYCSRKGLAVSYYSCMSGANFDYNKAKQEMINGRPTILFLDTFNVTDITLSDTSDLLSTNYSLGTHSMVGFGNMDVTYTFANNLKRTENYIIVASGMNDRLKGYLNINSNVTIDDVYGVDIF